MTLLPLLAVYFKAIAALSTAGTVLTVVAVVGVLLMLAGVSGIVVHHSSAVRDAEVGP
jgi:hypothetical protein